MQAEPKSTRRRIQGSTLKPLAVPEQNFDSGKARERVKWGPNEERGPGDHELDEMAKDPGAFTSLKRSLVQHRDTLGRGSEASTALKDLGVFVDSNEVDGLPVLPRQEKELEDEHSNSRRWPSFFGLRRRKGEIHDNITEHAEEEGIQGRRNKTETGDEDMFGGHGSGILSALLGLYDRHHKRASEASTPNSTDGEPLHREDNEGHGKPSTSRITRPQRSSRDLGIKDVFGMIAHDNILSKTRSDAGVFGPLMTATGNIAGAASPRHTAIAPDPTQPGHHLSRYSHADEGRHAPTPKSPPQSRPPSVVIESAHTTPVEERAGARTPDTPPKGKGSTLKGKGWASALKALTPVGSQDSPFTTDTEGDGADDKKGGRHKTKRKREDIFITMHVAHILHRQEFILKLTRAFLMFGAPSHRLETQLQATARILGLNVSCLYLPGIVLISFNDTATGTSNIKFVKQSSALDLGKLIDAWTLYWSVIHDEISVSDASSDLDQLMLRRPIYKGWVTVVIGGFCSSAICPIAFHGSFLDALMCFPLGALLVFVQNFAVKNELYSNVFEIVIATVMSFIAGGLASTGFFCYSALASASIVLILPGYIILCGSLEIASRNITSGAVRMCYSVIYSLFLGFGLAMGAEVYHQVSGSNVSGNSDYNCIASHHSNGPWWQKTPSPYWAFLCAPMYSLFLTLRNQSPWWKKELYVTIIIACGGWTANHFASKRFVNRNDISSALGAFVVGVAGNLYGRFFQGNAFVVMITGIMFQLPSGLSNGGLLAFASQSTQGSTETYASGFQVAEQLVSVAIGLTVGLFIAAVVVHPFASKRRGTALFSL